MFFELFKKSHESGWKFTWNTLHITMSFLVKHSVEKQHEPAFRSELDEKTKLLNLFFSTLWSF